MNYLSITAPSSILFFPYVSSSILAGGLVFPVCHRITQPVLVFLHLCLDHHLRNLSIGSFLLFCTPKFPQIVSWPRGLRVISIIQFSASWLYFSSGRVFDTNLHLLRGSIAFTVEALLLPCKFGFLFLLFDSNFVKNC